MLEDPNIDFMPTEGFTPIERNSLAGEAKQPERDSLSGNERNHLFLGVDGKQLQDVSGLSGLDHPGDARSFAVFDYNRDGWQDLAVVNANAPLLLLFRNQWGIQGQSQESGPFSVNNPPGRTAKLALNPVSPSRGKVIALRFVGSNHSASAAAGRSHRDGIGAKVAVSLSGMELLREHRAGEGMAAQNSATMLIGIGDRQQADSVSVTWPSRVVQKIGSVPAGRLVTVYEDAGQAPVPAGFVLEPYQVRPTPSLANASRRKTTGRKLVLETGGSQNAKASLRLYTGMATWCQNCQKEIPQVRRLRSVFGPGELDMFAVPMDERETKQDLNAYVTRYQPPYRLLRDLDAKQVASVQQLLRAELKSDGFPATIVTNRWGDVLAVVSGVPEISLLRKLLEQSVAEQSPPPAPKG